MYKYFFKRVMDIIIALCVLVILSPLFIIIIILLCFAYKGTDVFFIKSRPGKHGKIFRIIKFKTMNDSRDANGNLLPDAIRLTPVGKILRRNSLDEIPQFINVLKGDMSIIGPRPLAVSYLPLYNDFQKRRHEVKSGITGWAQVNGRNAITWEEKFKLDVWYVDNISFFLDIKILHMTIMNVLKGKGIGLVGSSIGSVTLEDFKGNIERMY